MYHNRKLTWNSGTNKGKDYNGLSLNKKGELKGFVGKSVGALKWITMEGVLWVFNDGSSKVGHEARRIIKAGTTTNLNNGYTYQIRKRHYFLRIVYNAVFFAK